MTGKWVLPALIASTAAAQSPCDTRGFMDRINVSFRTVSDRGGSWRRVCGDAIFKGDVIRRIVYDSFERPYFGYELKITPVGETQYRAEMRALKDSPLRTFSQFPPAVTFRAYEYVDIQVLEEVPRGNFIRDNFWLSYAYSLLVQAGLAEPIQRQAEPPGRVTDYFTVSPKGKAGMAIPQFHGFAKTLPPGTVLALDRPQISRPVYENPGIRSELGVIGPLVWIYREGSGRFLFSASARPGFERIGVAEGSLIQFAFTDGTVEFKRYAVGLRSDVVPQRGTWWIWVKREPEFQPPPGPWTKEELKRGVPAIGVQK